MQPQIIAAIIAGAATIVAAILGTVVSRRKKEREEKHPAEVIAYENSGDLVAAFEARIRKARQIDDVTWGEEDEREQWSGQDRMAHGHLYETIAQVISKSDVIWREVAMFSKQYEARFLQHRKFIEQGTAGYNLAYFEVPSPLRPTHRVCRD